MIVHLGTWIGFDTEGHKPVYEALLQKSGAKLRQASTDNDNITVRERFTNDNSAILFIGNYYNEEQEGKVTYTHPETGEAISIPFTQETMLWPALYAVLTPVCLQVSDGLKILHSTSDILSVTVEKELIAITLFGDRDLAGELIFEGEKVEKIMNAIFDVEKINMVWKNNRVVLNYKHWHQQEMKLMLKLR
jgi:hypothetical protein